MQTVTPVGVRELKLLHCVGKRTFVVSLYFPYIVLWVVGVKMCLCVFKAVDVCLFESKDS